METAVPRPRFSSRSPFHAELKRRVNQHFDSADRSRHGGPALWLKTAVMFAWLFGSYALAMWGDVNAWQAVLLACSMGLAAAGIGFNVMHDANHGSFSSRLGWNRLLGFSSDLIGVSSYVWRQKHNVIHHTFTNVSGVDADLETGGVLRLAPWQPRRAFHRFQHLYVWVLYALFPLRWWLIDDFQDVVRGRIGSQSIPRPPPSSLVALLVAKALFFTWAFVLPAVIHPGWGLVALWAVAISTLGIVLAVVFQLAHCTGDAAFLSQDRDVNADLDWAEHQVRTTVDFARENRWVCWYVGGLNFQIEHHLFPRISHVHYPALARIVESTCGEFGIPYKASPTLLQALGANVAWLESLGRRPSARFGVASVASGQPRPSAGALLPATSVDLSPTGS